MERLWKTTIGMTMMLGSIGYGLTPRGFSDTHYQLRGGQDPGTEGDVEPGELCDGVVNYQCKVPGTTMWCGRTIPQCKTGPGAILTCAISPTEQNCKELTTCEQYDAEKRP